MKTNKREMFNMKTEVKDNVVEIVEKFTFEDLMDRMDENIASEEEKRNFMLKGIGIGFSGAMLAVAVGYVLGSELNKRSN